MNSGNLAINDLMSGLKYRRLLIVGNPGEIHLGGHFIRAAQQLGLDATILDYSEAFAGPRLLRALSWRLLSKRPLRLNGFSRKVTEWCQHHQPDVILSTGIMPLDHSALRKIKDNGVTLINYLSDDPWNPAHASSWFMQALPLYDQVFSPRKANIEDLLRLNTPKVHYLPFGYSPAIHYPFESSRENSGYDMAFYGAIDTDRVQLLEAIVQSGIRLRLYSENRLPPTLGQFFQGYASPSMLREICTTAPVSLVVGRKANRDDNAMRSYEVPAMKGCILAEDSQTHRDLYGDAALFFTHTEELIEKAKLILQSSAATRQKMRETVYDRVVSGRNTYKDRLETIFNLLHT